MLAHLRLLRPRQMTKNLFCLAGVLFSGRFTQLHYVVAALWTFAAFCLASSAVYIGNDLIDRERDRLHPRKKNRPLASGAVSVPMAVALGIALIAGAAAIAATLPWGVLACLVLYLVNNVAYTLALKHMALFDVLCIAFGFVFRLLAGVYAVDELPTTWVTLCTFFLSVFLGFCKRRAELARLIPIDEKHLPADEKYQRPVLSKYTVQFLDYLVNSAAVMTIMCYALFTTSAYKNPTLVVTVPIVFFAVMHYKRLVMLWDTGEEPERIVIRDVRLLASAALWLICYFVIIYGNLRLFR